ncbi:adenylate/guanylate cyclase domain-containing protein [Stappia sp. WLB 29]|uniref:adenylate/guanylate cyclase domain-containing protein n=1 Tax=Stappia sp. WLB 29 TaxID=2925220 RepID=UPI00207668B3
MTGDQGSLNRERDGDRAAPELSARDMRRRGWARPLRVHLSTVIVALLLGISLPLTWLAHDQGTRLATSAASERMSLLGRRVAAQYEAVFNDGLTAVMLAAAADTLLEDPTGDMAGKALFLDRVLDTSPHIDGLYAARADGSFLHGVGDTAAWHAALGAPEGTDHAVRTIQPADDGTRRSAWRFLSADGREISRREQGVTRFDPRRRPWYREAVAASGRPVTVGPYTMATTGELGLTIAVEAPDEPGAVVGADLLLQTLSDLLSREAVSPRASGYVFDEAGRLIVHSDPAMMAALLPQLSSRSRHTAVSLDDPLLPLLLPRLGPDTVSGLHRIEAGGETYLLALEPVRGAAELAGTVVAVAAPLSDFTAESRLLLARALIVSVSLIVMGVLSALLVARLVSRSLTQLADDAARIGDLDLETRPLVSSLVAEINTLAGALATARTAIASFALYVPRELVRKVVAAGRQDPASAERRDVTVLFTDIRDFTTLSEQHAPEEVVALLSDYFELLNRIVEAHDGVIVQYLGDAVCAMWNAPESNPDHVADACRCTLALVAAVDALNAGNRAAGRPELATRFGLHTGIAVVGSVGASTRRQYTAIGDTINVASRLEGMNKEFGTTVLTSEAVRAAAGDEAFAFRPLGSARAKGRAAEIAVYELTAP